MTKNTTLNPVKELRPDNGVEAVIESLQKPLLNEDED